LGTHSDDKHFQILSLSGGGIRGLYTIQVLATLEEQLAEQHNDKEYCIGRHFDLISGTSIGGLIALGLANGVTARHILQEMNKNRLTIFPSKSRFLKKWSAAFSSLYQQAPLKKLLKDIYGEATIGSLNTRVVIPTINYSKGQVQVFKTPHCKQFKFDHVHSLADIALATSAAPTFFPIHEFNDNWYLDGGLAANSPAFIAVHEASYFLNIPLGKIRLLQVGTMGNKTTTNHKGAKDGGYLSRWGVGSKLIEICLSATEGLHNYLATHLLDANSEHLAIDMSPSRDQCSVLELDNASDEAAKTLISCGKVSAQEYCCNPIYEKIIAQKASEPTFFYGVNRNI
jgi:patatin-like phospholipase/acyl hydrolase